MSDTRFKTPLRGLSTMQLPGVMKRVIKKVERLLPPRTGVIVFAFDFGEGGGMAYVSNADRDDAIRALEEWIRKQRTEQN